MSFVDPKENEKSSAPTPPVVENPEEYPLMKKLEKICKAIEDNTQQLKLIADTLVGYLKMKEQNVPVVQTPITTPTQTQTPSQTPEEPVDSNLSWIETTVKPSFTEDLRSLLVFTAIENGVEISPRQYLGSENFAKIASVVRNLGGKYVSAGKESHFVVER